MLKYHTLSLVVAVLFGLNVPGRAAPATAGPPTPPLVQPAGNWAHRGMAGIMIHNSRTGTISSLRMAGLLKKVNMANGPPCHKPEKPPHHVKAASRSCSIYIYHIWRLNSREIAGKARRGSMTVVARASWAGGIRKAINAPLEWVGTSLRRWNHKNGHARARRSVAQEPAMSACRLPRNEDGSAIAPRCGRRRRSL